MSFFFPCFLLLRQRSVEVLLRGDVAERPVQPAAAVVPAHVGEVVEATVVVGHPLVVDALVLELLSLRKIIKLKALCPIFAKEKSKKEFCQPATGPNVPPCWHLPARHRSPHPNPRAQTPSANNARPPGTGSGYQSHQVVSPAHRQHRDRLRQADDRSGR